jgi:FkbM family methyltransferase
MDGALFCAKVLRKLGFIQRGWLESLNFRLVKNLNGKRFIIPIIKNIGWTNIFSHDPWMYQLMTKILPERSGAFMDIGANIGQTLMKLKSVDSTIPYWGFEPNPVCQFYLKELIAFNRFGSVSLVPAGLSDKGGLAELNFYSSNPDDATASVINNLRPGAVVTGIDHVYLATLDELMAAIRSKVSLIKIDVEGAELEVLKGSLSVIRRDRPLILIEVLPAYCAENRVRIDRQAELEQLIRGESYLIYLLVKDRESNLKEIRRITTIGIMTDIADIDFLLVPEEDIRTLEIIK